MKINLYPSKRNKRGLTREEQRKLNGLLFENIKFFGIEEVKKAIRSGANVNAKRKKYTPLIEAISTGRIEMVRCLIDAGAKISACTDNCYTTLLTVLISFGRAEILSFLLARGLDIKPSGCKQYFPLHLACVWSDAEAVDLLIKAGADVNAPNNKGNMPIHEAAMGWMRQQILNVLLEAGADVNARNWHKQTPVHLAASFNKVENLKCLVEGGADLMAVDRDGASPFELARRYENTEVIEYLIVSCPEYFMEAITL